MREYGVVYGCFWGSESIKAAGEDGRTLALYLLTSQFGNIVGCYRMPVALAGSEVGWSIKRTEKAFASLAEVGFIERTGDLVLIPDFLRWNPIGGPNQEIAAMKEAKKLPAAVGSRLAELVECYRAYDQTDTHRTAIARAVLKGSGTHREPIENPSRTHREPKPNQDQEQEHHQEQDHEQELPNQKHVPDGDSVKLPTEYLGGPH